MPKRKEPELDAKEQHAKFVKAARELGTDKSEEAFDKVLGKIASAPPPKSVQKRRKADIERRKQIVPSRQKKKPKRG